jgi:photosystem II stability/assembly factor-like uncharacterized protein
MPSVRQTASVLARLHDARPGDDFVGFASDEPDAQRLLERLLELPREDPLPALELGPQLPWRRTRARRRLPMVISVAIAVVVAGVLVPLLTLGVRSGQSTAARFQLVNDDIAAGFVSIFHRAWQPVAMDCPTVSTCYVQNSAGGRPTLLKSSDGGTTWTQIAEPPGDDFLQLTSNSCSSAALCVGTLVATDGTSLDTFAMTTNGGATWRSIAEPRTPDDQSTRESMVSCVGAERCVVYVRFDAYVAAAHAAFFTTTDGGVTWTKSTSEPATISSHAEPEALRCESNGRCIALLSVPSPPSDVEPFALEAARSSDFGKSWTVTPPSSVSPSANADVSCGDALHCMAAWTNPTGLGVGLATTSNGGRTWQVRTTPSGFANLATNVSCSSASRCTVATSEYSPRSPGSDYDVPKYAVVETTSNGGATWSKVPLPNSADGYALLNLVDLDCPSADGCVALARTSAENHLFGNSVAGMDEELSKSWVVLSSLGMGS